jgi:cell division protein FtsL
MAAFVATLESGLGWTARAAERNAELMATQAERRRRVRMPEYFLAKRIDNTRLVKAADPVRIREMRVFSAAVTVLFSLIMVYGLQHFYAIESSYHVESEKQTLNQLREENRQLRLSEAELSQPGRIDQLAHGMGLTVPQPGQVVHPNAAPADSGAPVLAQVAPSVQKGSF